MTSSPSPPSSSAVRIPIPGKSILKKPPAAPQSLLSRISRFLPSTPTPSSSEEKDALRRAHFILPQIAVVYPISNLLPPSTPGLKDEKKAIEEREGERRRRVVRRESTASIREERKAEGREKEKEKKEEEDEWWEMEKVEGFYRECCVGCEERPDPGISAALKHAAHSNPRTVDFSGIELTLSKASVLSDVFSIEWGLRKLVFRECDLDDMILKPILHSLLIPDTLTFLSVASNRRLKVNAFRLIGAYLSKSNSLQFLDLSLNLLDKKSVEYLVAALREAPPPGAEPKDEEIKPKYAGLMSLKLDDCGLRPASLEILSRHVRTSTLQHISLRHNKINATGAVALALMIRDYPDSIPIASPPGTPTPSVPSSASSTPPQTPTVPPAAGPLLPPPRHPPPAGVQTTYTPYVPRARRKPGVNTPVSSPPTHSVPIITSNSQGGVTTRHEPPPSHNSNHMDRGPSAALLDKVRALDNLPRLGALRTLDLRGNDLRTGLPYLAQVLKRNRTLKVLNLAENRLDVSALVGLGDALKYNSCLEMLDLSRNPCSGPGLEGIQSLRTAFTLNTALKRLFLSSTGLTSAGAIALAEFLPESRSLLHLDLTSNTLDLAGVMALSGGLKRNWTMRCLDLNIPPGDEGYARICREILNTCVRNTEAAGGTGVKLIDESELARSVRETEFPGDDDADEILNKAQACSDPSAAKVLLDKLARLIEVEGEGERIEEMLGLHDRLSALAATSRRPVLKLGIVSSRSPLPTPTKEYDDGLVTPRIDKGKARAEPEHEPVLSPTSALVGGGPPSDTETDTEPMSEAETVEEEEGEEETTDRSRSWVEEEGEVFRKGTRLLGPEEMEGEYAGEELRKELLEAMVERPPPRPLTDEFGVEIPGSHHHHQHRERDQTSSKEEDENDKEGEVSSPTTPTPGSGPRPYVVRRRSSSSSIMSLVVPSPAIPAPGSPRLESIPQQPEECSKEPGLNGHADLNGDILEGSPPITRMHTV